MQGALKQEETFLKVFADFTKTFQQLGAGQLQAQKCAKKVMSAITDAEVLEDAEKTIKQFFIDERLDGQSVFEIIIKNLHERIEIIFEQVKPCLKDINGIVIDYGCGSGLLAQIVHDRLGLTLEGVDVRDFRSPEVAVKIKIFDGYSVPVSDRYYECAILTNVIHHEVDNEKILAELNRIVSKRLVIIETVPEADTEELAQKDWGRMLLNDALWNRFFNYANIPVPGTYETPFTWVRRFEKYGWRCVLSKDLGFDQPMIQDRHHLMVFER